MLTDISKVKRVASHFVTILFLVGVVSSALDFTVGQVFGDVLADFEQAEIYLGENQFVQAQEIYENIVQQHPGTKHALMAQSGFVRLYILSGQLQEAEIALEQLLQNFQQHEDIAQAVLDAIEEYLLAEPPQYQKVLELSEWVLANGPDRKDAIWAQANIVIANIKLGNVSAADTAYQILVNQFGSHKDMPNVVCCVAGHWKNKDDTKSHELYENALSSWPGCVDTATEESVVHWANIAMLRVQFGDDAGSQVAFEKMINNSSKLEGDEFGASISEVADAYLNLGKAQKALELLQSAQERLSGTEHEIWIKTGMVRLYISLGDDPNDQQLNELRTDFSEHPKLSEAIFYVAKQYYQTAADFESKSNTNKSRQCLQKAITLWKNIPLDPNLSDHELFNEDRHFMIAETYRRLGQDKEAIEHYKKVIAARPNYKQAPHIHFMIGDGYERLKKAKIVSASSADIEIERSYQKAVESNPDSPAAKIAAKRLKKNYQAR